MPLAMTQLEREELKAWAQLAASKEAPMGMMVDPGTILALFEYVEAVEEESARSIEQLEEHGEEEYERGYEEGLEDGLNK